MSRNNDFLMEVLDGEVPAEYRASIEKEIASDPLQAARLERFRAVSQLMKDADGPLQKEFSERQIRLKARLERSMAATDSKGVKRKANSKRAARFRMLSIPMPAVAAAGFAVVFLAAFSLVPALNRGNQTQLASDANSVNMSNSAEFSNLDPNFYNLLPVSENSLHSTGDSAEGINLQINVRDVEQLLRLLEGTRNMNQSINDITIQLPAENQLQILGDSQLRRVVPEEAQ